MTQDPVQIGDHPDPERIRARLLHLASLTQEIEQEYWAAAEEHRARLTTAREEIRQISLVLHGEWPDADPPSQPPMGDTPHAEGP